MSTFRPSCTHNTRVVRKSSGLVKNNTQGDHNISDTLALTNRFQVLQEMNIDIQNLTHENANAECSTPYDTVPGQSKNSHNDHVSLILKVKKSMPGSLAEQTTQPNTSLDGGHTHNSESVGAFEPNR